LLSSPRGKALPVAAAAALVVVAACGGGGGGTAGTTSMPTTTVPGLAGNSQLALPAGFSATIVANIRGARELTALPDGDLLVGTLGSTIEIVRSAEGPGTPLAATFATLPDAVAASVFYGPDGNLYAGTEHGIWRIGYRAGAATAGSIAQIGAVRTGAISPTSDGDVHTTTSVAVSSSTLYAGVGSDCDACGEVDPTRASIQQLSLGGGSITTKAKNVRNAIAFAVDPSTGYVWTGGAGQDKLAAGHPYETLDAVSARPGVVDYGWPTCYENAVSVAGTGAACSGMTVSAIVLPAYATLIGATFYPASQSGAYAFPAAYRGGVFVSMHGSWHTIAGGLSAAQPQVVYVPFSAGSPATAVNWSNPNTQWQPFFFNFGTTANNRVGRPTGLAVGSQGSLFVADDAAGNIYRIRPDVPATQSSNRRGGS
jgi:glucose/arabinose dehydrogenase